MVNLMSIHTLVHLEKIPKKSISIEQPAISGSREFLPGTGPHLLQIVAHPRMCVKILINIAAPYTQ